MRHFLAMKFPLKPVAGGGLLFLVAVVSVYGVSLVVRPRATTGEEAFCIADLSTAERNAHRSWKEALPLVNHYEMCPWASDKESYAKTRSLLKFWISRGNADAMYEFAERDFLYSNNPIDQQEGKRLLTLAAALGQPDAKREIPHQQRFPTSP